MSKHRKEKDNFACQLYLYLNLSRLWSRAFIGKRFKSRSLRLWTESTQLISFSMRALIFSDGKYICLMQPKAFSYIHFYTCLVPFLDGFLPLPFEDRRYSKRSLHNVQRCISSMYWVRWDERIATIAFLNVVEQNEHTVQIATPFKLKVNSWRQAAADDSQLTWLKSFSRAKKRVAFLI